MHERDAFVRGTACIFRYIDQIKALYVRLICIDMKKTDNKQILKLFIPGGETARK